MIPCISILQPYAWLIVNGFKPVENRTWATKFRGRILIHAGVRYSKGDYEFDFESYHQEERFRNLNYPEREAMIGGIVGEAVITDCVTEHQSEYFNGPYAFVLTDAKAYPRLIPYRGQLGIFGVPSAVLEGVAA